MIVVDILRRAGILVTMASVMGRLDVPSSRNIVVKADIQAEDADFDSPDMVYLPGGRAGTENLQKSEIVLKQCREFSEQKLVSAICAAPSILAGLGLLDGKKATCHPDYENKMAGAILTKESVAVDGNFITGQGLGATFPFAFEIVNAFLGPDKVKQIKHSICYREQKIHTLLSE
jgi:4-methyl-5(b-hydroxyethyl)-thiazole monophosphate biosynthesis